MVTLSPGAQWNGTPGRPNHPTAPLCCGKPIKSPPDKADGQYHLLPFLGEIISSWVGFYCNCGHSANRLWVADAEFPMLSSYLRAMISLVWYSEHHVLLCMWPSKFYKNMGSWQGCEVFIFCVKICQVKSWHIYIFLSYWENIKRWICNCMFVLNDI